MHNEKWDRRFLGLARHIATWSKDPSTKVGAVVLGPNRDVRATGYNGFPPGIDDDIPERKERPLRYTLTSHAEANCVGFAALNGVALAGCTMYTSVFSCPECAKLIIRAGIKRVVSPPAPAPIGVPNDWRELCRYSALLFMEAGVELSLYPEDE